MNAKVTKVAPFAYETSVYMLQYVSRYLRVHSLRVITNNNNSAKATFYLNLRESRAPVDGGPLSLVGGLAEKRLCMCQLFFSDATYAAQTARSVQ